jgi:transposase
VEQQGRLMVHRARQGFVEQRTATLNRIRGLLSEVGIVLPLKAATVRREAAAALEDLPGWANTVVGDLLSEVGRLDERIAQYDRHIAQMAREDERVRRLMRLRGVGETTATALVAMIGNGGEFASGRQLRAPGWAWCPGSTARAARRGWGGSPRRATRTCARCW